MGLQVSKKAVLLLRYKAHFWRIRMIHTLASRLWAQEFPTLRIDRLSHAYNIFYWYFEKRIEEVLHEQETAAKDERKPTSSESSITFNRRKDLSYHG